MENEQLTDELTAAEAAYREAEERYLKARAATRNNQDVFLPDVNERSFECNGKIYRVAASLSVERYEILERFEIEFGFGVTFKTMFDAWVEQYNCLNADKRADAAVNAYKVINGMTNIDNAQIYAFQLCTLFINADGEDVRYYDTELAAKKVQDWKDGGIDSRFFFHHAARSVNEYFSVYRSLVQDISAVLSQRKGSENPSPPSS